MDIGKLNSQMGLDIKPFESNLTKARAATLSFSQKTSEGISSLNSKFSMLTKAVTGFVAAMAVKQVLTGIRDAINELDDLADKAAEIGLTTDALQELRATGEVFGQSFEETDRALTKFTKGIYDAQRGTGELHKVFERYNISMKDTGGNFKTNEQLLSDFADAIQRAGNATEQGGMAMAAFGIKNGGLVNALKEGSSGLREFGDRAHATGKVIDASIVMSAAEAGDKLDEMSRTLKTQLTMAFAQAAPGITALGNAFAVATPKLVAFMENLFLDENERSIMTMKFNLADLDEAIARHQETVANAKGGSYNLFEDGSYVTAMHEIKRLEEERHDLLIDMEIKTLAVAAAEHERAEAVNRENVALQEQLTIEQAQADAAAEAERLAKLDMERSKDRIRAANDLIDAANKDLDAWVKAQDAYEKAQGAAAEAWKDAIDPIRVYQREIEEVLLLYQQHRLSAEEMAEAVAVIGEKAAKDFNKVDEATKDANETAEEFGLTIASALGEVIKKGGDASDVMQALAQDIINMVIKAKVLDPIAEAIGGAASGTGSGGGNWFTNIFAGMFKGKGKAGGGTINGLTMVGERGSEIIAPPGPARVLTQQTANNLAGKSEVKVTVVNNGTPQRVVSATAQPDIRGMIIQVVVDDMQKGGPIDGAQRRLYGSRRVG